MQTPQIAVNETDDPGFLVPLNALLRETVSSHAPELVWIIQIDNWFDHKWLRFSGNGAIASGFAVDRWDTVKSVFYKHKLTFPPFAPNRVTSQSSFTRGAASYIESPSTPLPHPTVTKISEANLNRRIQNEVRSACLVWYSGNTVANGRGSVMVYIVDDEATDCWFVGLKRSGYDWNITSTKGVNRSYVDRIVSGEK